MSFWVCLECSFKNAYNELKVDDWMLNPSVHFTIWAIGLSTKELLDLAQSFKSFVKNSFAKTVDKSLKLLQI